MHYDEFGLFHENAEEAGLPWEGPPVVRRAAVEVEPGRSLSALVWGTAPPELVLLHGGAQNAHTWDTLALALDRPLVAIDLPGHGHSDHRETGLFDPVANAGDVAVAIQALAPANQMVVGMSLGGLTAIALATRASHVVHKLALVDVTPGVDRDKAAPIAAFIAGPETFESFDEILARTIEFNPTRSESSLRRGILHNAVQLEDGTWQWRHRRDRPDRPAPAGAPDPDAVSARIRRLWDVISSLTMPVLLVRGMARGS